MLQGVDPNANTSAFKTTYYSCIIDVGDVIYTNSDMIKYIYKQ